jgi:hypothetical protein
LRRRDGVIWKANLSNTQYSAFISYSHSDSAWGNWLHKRLETYAIPARLRVSRPELGKTLYPIFRDREELPGSADLGTNLRDALAQSAKLLVICSPNSAQSMWVNEEIISFQKLAPGKSIVAVIIGGDFEQSTSGEFALPDEVQTLRGAASPLLTLVDARRGGMSVETMLQLVAALTALDVDDLRRRETHRARVRWTGAALAAVLAVVLGAIVVQRIDEAARAQQVAQSEQLAAVAEQALGSGDLALALRAALAALPANLDDAERPVSARAAAVLHTALARPALRLLRHKLSHGAVALLNAQDSQQWLILDQQDHFQLYDARSQRIRWRSSYGKVVRSAVNEAGHLVVRTDTALLSVDAQSGEVRCELALTTQPSPALPGSLPWLQKNWIVEWQMADPTQAITFVTGHALVDTSTCTAQPPRPAFGVTSGVYLLDVAADGASVTASEVYDSSTQKTFVQLLKWPAQKSGTASPLGSFSGRLKSLLPGPLNDRQFEGPLLQTDPRRSVFYAAFQTKSDGKARRYGLIAFDWQQKKIVSRSPISRRPLSLTWSNSKKDALFLQVAGETSIDGKAYTIDAQAWKVLDKMPAPKALPGSAAVTRFDPGNRYWLVDTINGSELARPGAQQAIVWPPAAATPSIVIGHDWIDQRNAIQVLSDGSISTIHISADGFGDRIAGQAAVLRHWSEVEVGRHLVYLHDGSLNWLAIDSGQLAPILTLPVHRERTFEGPFDGRYLFTEIDEDQSRTMALIDLRSGETIFEKRISRLGMRRVAADHLLFADKDAPMVLIPYATADTPRQLPLEHSVDASLSADGNSVHVVYTQGEYTDAPSFVVETLALADLSRRTLHRFDAHDSASSTAFHFERGRDALLLATALTPRAGQRSVRRIDLATMHDKALGTLDLGLIGALNPFDAITINASYLHFKDHSFASLGQQSDVVFNVDSAVSREFSADKGQRLLLAGALLATGHVLIAERQQAQLVHLATGEHAALSCSMSVAGGPTHFQYFADDDLLFVAVGARVCAVRVADKATLFDAIMPRPLGEHMAFAGNAQALDIYPSKRAGSYTVVFASGLAQEVAISASWDDSVRAARSYGLAPFVSGAAKSSKVD